MITCTITGVVPQPRTKVPDAGTVRYLHRSVDGENKKNERRLRLHEPIQLRSDETGFGWRVLDSRQVHEKMR